MKFNRLIKAVCLSLMAALMTVLFAGCAPATGTAAAEGSTGGGASMIIMIVLMIAVFWLFLIRPENKKKKQAEEMRSSLSVGDQITTIGGLMGRIVAVTGDYIVFETGEDRVRIQVTKWAISTKGKQTEEQK